MVFESSWVYFFGPHDSNENCQDWYHKMASLFVYLLLPVAGLILLWLRKELFTRILIRIDGLYLPIGYPNFGRAKIVLDWARRRLPRQWSSHLSTLAGGFVDFWRDGSLLCTLINSAIPGACANPYRHWKKPPIHAQDVAYKYLGIIPVFSQSDFTSQLSPYLEAKLLNYLYLLRKSINTLEKEKLIYSLISSKFAARGMGLYTADQFKQSEFYIYSKYGNVSFFNIEINISGPYSTCCRTTVLEYLVKESKTKSYKTNCESSSESISIQVEIDSNRVRIAYITKHCGIHEISINCKKESIMGSPFYVNVIKGSDNCFKSDADKMKNFAVQTEDGKKISENNADNQLKQNNVENFSKEEIGVYNKKSTIFLQEDWNSMNHAVMGDKNSFISSCQTMEISKYLKDLSNSQEKKVNIRSSLLTSRDKIWANCPDYFTRENYLYFQKLVDISFRNICRVTRAHPKFSQKKISQFSSASPICSDHIAPEGYRKLTAEEKRKVFAIQKSSAIGDEMRKNSSFSIKENIEEKKAAALGESVNHKPVIVGEVLVNSKDQKAVMNQKEVKRLKCDVKKKNLQKTIQEKKLFWESVFKEPDVQLERCSKELPRSTSVRDSDNISYCTLKHVDSLCLLRKRPLSKSLSDLRKIDSGKTLQSYRSVDDSLVICGNMSIEDRTKLYLENARHLSGKFIDQFAIVNKAILEKHGMTEKVLRETTTKDYEDFALNENRFCKAVLTKLPKKSLPYGRASELVTVNSSYNERISMLPKNSSEMNDVVLGVDVVVKEIYGLNSGKVNTVKALSKVSNNASPCATYSELRTYYQRERAYFTSGNYNRKQNSDINKFDVLY